MTGHALSSEQASAPRVCAQAATIMRLEAALARLETLVAERDAEIRRLRHVEGAAIEALAAMDACLEPAAAMPVPAIAVA